MINISHVVEEIIKESPILQKTLSLKIANYSAISRKIQKEVESRTFKNVDRDSIKVAIARLAKELENKEQNSFIIKNLSIHSNLCEVSFEKTANAIENLDQTLKNIKHDANEFYTVTRSLGEITIIAEEEVAKKIKKETNNQGVFFEKHNLAGITVKFGLELLDMPNVLFDIYSLIAAKDINVVEVVSTTTEITFIIDKKDLSVGITQLSALLKK